MTRITAGGQNSWCEWLQKSSVIHLSQTFPFSFIISESHPNSRSVRISWPLPSLLHVFLFFFDTLTQIVSSLLREERTPPPVMGEMEMSWNEGSEWAPSNMWIQARLHDFSAVQWSFHCVCTSLSFYLSLSVLEQLNDGDIGAKEVPDCWKALTQSKRLHACFRLCPDSWLNALWILDSWKMLLVLPELPRSSLRHTRHIFIQNSLLYR